MSAFSQAQLALLRERLLRAQKRFAVDGVEASWEMLLERVREAPQDESLDLPDGGYDFKSEVLRRLAEGISPSTAPRQRAVLSFLIVSELLTPEEFDDAGDDDAQVFAIYMRLGNTSAAARARLMELASRGELLDHDDKGDTTLSLMPDEASDFCRVKEAAYLGVDGTRRDKLRTGYAFLSTEANLLHVFVTGESARDRVNYFEVPGSTGAPLLLRVGPPVSGSTVDAAKTSLFRFEPNGEQTRLDNIRRTIDRGDQNE